ncbi:MAG: 16S rRNA (adenine(1518)-N(6)/adenine(1519)-N(6))-dimethyltransferase RsmA [Candidatus Spechtbacterales bacterium]
MLLNWTKNLLGEHGIKPNKRLGQNFLIDVDAMHKLLSAAHISKDDIVLEVGAGIGTITLELAKLAKKVIAVEKDRALIPILKETTKDFGNIEMVVGDILKLPYTLYPVPCTLVGNIPYYLTAPLIRKFVESENPPESMTLMVQKEMAQRICSKPPDMSILAVSVQVYAKPEIVDYVSRSCFWPAPEVDSAILRITQINTDMNTDMHRFFKLVKAGFSNPRKQLINNLSKGLDINREQTQQWLKSCGVDPTRRAETLAVEEWAHLAKLSP